MDILPMNVIETIAAQEAGRDLRFRFFWGHRTSAPGQLGDECLSQWWMASFAEEGRTFRSAEHYMMAHKAWLFGDTQAAEKILKSWHPNDAKRIGRTVRGFREDHWARHRTVIVTRGNLTKFRQHPRLAGYLMSTHPEILVEASPYDRIWGIGMDRTHPHAFLARAWRGMNLLGFSLMWVRQTLISER